MAPIGETSPAFASREALQLAHERAALMPDCLVEARRVASTVIAGWHGRRRRGIGEDFWQFRPYAEGESFSRIDWRRSARDDHTYVRDREWEAAHTILLHADPSASMRYRSRFAPTSKEARSLVLLLALAETLARSGERIGVPGVLEPQASRQSSERIATALSHRTAQSPAIPDPATIRGHADLVLFGDFLDHPDRIVAALRPLAHRGIRGHLVEIADPAEESFPYAGRTEFTDPETGRALTAGRADNLADDYRNAYLARRETLAAEMRRMGWNHLVHRTDRPASEPLATLHLMLSEDARA